MKSSLQSHFKFSLTVALFAAAWALNPQNTGAVTSPPPAVIVYSAAADLSTHVIKITGDNFVTTTPGVKLNNVALTVTSFSTTTIQATIPNSFTPGSYLLSVSTGNGTTFNDEFYVAISNGGSGGNEDRGNGNTAAESVQALNSNTSGVNNTATGWQALFSNTTGSGNAAEGYQALFSNTTGVSNTATGQGALYSNTDGFANTGTGYQALFSNTGIANTATGREALFSNTTGNLNTATGQRSLWLNTTGTQNTADGSSALRVNETGCCNTAIGFNTMLSNTTGNANTAVGQGALRDNTSGVRNIAVGYAAGINLDTGDNNIDIGNTGHPGEANTIRIGREFQTATFIAGISGTPVAGVTVVVDGNGQLGVLVSSQSFKDEIKPMDKSSEAILSLKPVTFRYKHDIDPKNMPQFGLVAEDVEKVNPDLVARDAEGKVYTVRYEAVNAMLLNEFLKEHKQVQEQQKQIEKLSAQLKEQATQIEKVSAQIDATKPAPQMIANQ